MSSKLRVGVLLPTRGILMGDVRPLGIEDVLRIAERADQAGLDSVWVGDSLTAKPRLEPMSTLSAIAMHTSNVRLGTAVMLGPLRHPVSLAHAATTVDLISKGRLVLGMGVGGAFNEAQRVEWKNVDISSRSRASRFEELIKVFKLLTKGENVTFRGKHFSIQDVSIRPVSPQQNGVPVLIAAHGRSKLNRQYERVLLGDGLISISDFPSEYENVLERVRHYSVQKGRNFDDLEKSFYMTVNMNSDHQVAEEEADRFLKLYYGINIWGERWGPWGNPKEVIKRIRRYSEAGVETIIVRFASFNQDRQMDLFLNEVVPYV